MKNFDACQEAYDNQEDPSYWEEDYPAGCPACLELLSECTCNEEDK